MLIFKKIRNFLFILFIIFDSINLFSSSKDIGTKNSNFLALDRGVKAISMAGSYVAIEGDIENMYNNPAGLAFLNYKTIKIEHSMWLEDIYFSGIGYAGVLKNGAFGFSVNYLGMDNMDKINNEGNTVGKYSPSDLILQGTYAHIISGHQALGLNIKFLNSKIEDDTLKECVYDLGYIYVNLVDGLNFGTSLSNIGDNNDVKKLKSGFSYQFSEKFYFNTEVQVPNDNKESYHIGGNYKIYKEKTNEVAIRSGYKFTEKEEDMKGISLGLGIRTKYFGFDFAWTPFEELGDTFRFGVDFVITKESLSGFYKELRKIRREVVTGYEKTNEGYFEFDKKNKLTDIPTEEIKIEKYNDETSKLFVDKNNIPEFSTINSKSTENYINENLNK